MRTIACLLALLLLLTGCADLPPSAVRASTAGPGVVIPEQLLLMPGLGRKRQIRLYLPPDYATSGKSYPVLYMHDGQNLFDAKTSYRDEWGVDEMLDARFATGKPGIIVVGIDSGVDRNWELSPWDDAYYGPGEGKQYMAFIVNVVKPYVDRNYRTRPERAFTGIMGASMGGLISDFAIHAYPQVFGAAGIFSPSFTTNDSYQFVIDKPLDPGARMYFIVGEGESESMVSGTRRMAWMLKRSGHPSNLVAYKVVDGGHTTATWSADFINAVEWMFAVQPSASTTTTGP